MAAARKHVYDLSKVESADLELPPSQREPAPPTSATHQRRSIEPWKTLERSAVVGKPLERTPVREHVKVAPKKKYGSLIFNAFLVLAGVGGSTAALVRFAHRASGLDFVPLVRGALDGHSVLLSSVASLVTLAMTITLAIMALYARPRSMGYGLGALAMVVVAITTMSIALSARPGAPAPSEETPFLVAWAFPFMPLGIALRLVWNGWAGCAEREGLGRLKGFLLGSLASAVGFVAVELFFGAGLGRLLARIVH